MFVEFCIFIKPILGGHAAFLLPLAGMISCANENSTILLWTKTCPLKMA